jgi:protein phosphatase
LVNQDRFLSRHPIYIVADGGGHLGGGRASEIALSEAAHRARELILASPTGPYGKSPLSLKDLEDVAARCQRAVREAAVQDPGLRRMATTLTMAIVTWPIVQVVHVGDSRCYALRDGNLQLMTEDQTVGGRLHRAGIMTEAALERSPLRDILVSTISDGDKDAKPQIAQWRLQPGDALVLCTDGVSGVLSERDMLDIVRNAPTAEWASGALIRSASLAGTADDATAVVARFPVAARCAPVLVLGGQFLDGQFVDGQADRVARLGLLEPQ